MRKGRGAIVALGILLLGLLSSVITYVGLSLLGLVQLDNKEVLTFTVEDVEKEYDGTPLKASQYYIEEQLPDGYSVYVDYLGELTQVGSTLSSLEVQVFDAEDVDVTSSWNAGVLTVELSYPFKTAVTEIGTVTLTPATTSSTHTIKVSGNAVYDVNLDTNTEFDVEEDIPVIGGINEAIYTVTVTPSSSGVTQGPSTTRPSTPTSPAPSSPAPSKPDKADDIMPTVKPDKPIEPDVPDAPKGFTDIADVSWATESINKLLELGVVSESEDGKFNPNNNIKRSEFIKLIVEALDLNDENATSSFNDVAKDAWYYTYAAAAQKAGIVLGGDDGKFNPDAYITRQDMSVIIARALKFYGIGENEEQSLIFDDDASISDYAKDAIYLLKDLGIINGTGENNFTPLGNATRAQTAKMVCGIIEVVSK